MILVYWLPWQPKNRHIWVRIIKISSRNQHLWISFIFKNYEPGIWEAQNWGFFFNVNCYSRAIAARAQVCLVQNEENFTKIYIHRFIHVMLLGMWQAWNRALQIPALYPELELGHKYFIWPGVFWTQTHKSFGWYSNKQMFKIKYISYHSMQHMS